LHVLLYALNGRVRELPNTLRALALLSAGLLLRESAF
jgi:hypothetical protein